MAWDRKALAAVAVLLAATRCTNPGAQAVPPGPPLRAPAFALGTSRAIKHVIVVVQENRSFNSLFLGYPGARTRASGPTHTGARVPVKPITLESNGRFGGVDIDHSHQTSFVVEYDRGKLDGFDLIHFGSEGGGPPAKLYPYAYVERSEVQPYWDMAAQYALGDRMFSTATTGSFIAHQELIAGTSRLDAHASLTDYPTGIPWGCDAPAFTVTAVLDADGHENRVGGPFPCLTSYPTMADVLDAAKVSWKFYAPAIAGRHSDIGGALWNGFDAISSVRNGPDWATHMSMPNTTIFTDLDAGTLPEVSWIVPVFSDSDHPASGSKSGPSWVTSIVDAVGKSKYWKSTAIVVLWDDWGGFYDPVRPPQLDYAGLGFRVPMIVVSPFAKRGYVSHTQYEFGSVLKFVEQNFGLASLGSTDVRANSIVDCFDFAQPPRAFRPIAAPYPKAYFLRPRPHASIQEIVERDGYPG